MWFSSLLLAVIDLHYLFEWWVLRIDGIFLVVLMININHP